MTEPMLWPLGMTKWEKIEVWTINVLADRELPRGSVKVAWALGFLFHSRTGAAWPSFATIGDTVAMTSESVREAVRILKERGHLVRRVEPIKGKATWVMRPALASTAPKVLKIGKRAANSPTPPKPKNDEGGGQSYGEGVGHSYGGGVGQSSPM